MGAGLIATSQASLTEKTAKQFGVTAGRTTSLLTDALDDGFVEDEADGVCPFHELERME